MNWTIIGHIADILSIIGFLISLGIFRKISSKAIMQKQTYITERDALLSDLEILQQNIWSDGLITNRTQDNLRNKVIEYQIKYLFISSPRCIFHAFRCTFLLNSGITESNTQKIRSDICYLIARLSKKE